MNETNDVIANNIKYLIKRSDLNSVTELARRLDINQPTMHRLITGEIRDPKYTMLKQISDYFRISPSDLAEKNLQALQEDANSGLPYITLRYSKIPVLGNTQLGPEEYLNDQQYSKSYTGYILWPTTDRDAFALKCEEDTLMPRIKAGEFIIMEPNHTYAPGDEVLVLTFKNEVLIKTFLFERDGICNFMSVNENHSLFRVAHTEISIMQYIAGIAKSTLWYP